MKKSKNIIEKEMLVMTQILFYNYCSNRGLMKKDHGFNDIFKAIKKFKIKKSTLQDILERLENRKWIKKHTLKNNRVYFKVIHPFNPNKAPTGTKRLWQAWRIRTRKYWGIRIVELKRIEKRGRKTREQKLKVLRRQSTTPEYSKEKISYVVKDTKGNITLVPIEDIIVIPK